MSKPFLKWNVQSESNPTKFYTVSRNTDGSFSCSCPAWIYRRKECKHIKGVCSSVIGVPETDREILNKFKFISKMHSIKLSCENCKHYPQSRRPSFLYSCNLGVSTLTNDLIFMKNGTNNFYILGKCCPHYERKKDQE